MESLSRYKRLIPGVEQRWNTVQFIKQQQQFLDYKIYYITWSRSLVYEGKRVLNNNNDIQPQRQPKTTTNHEKYLINIFYTTIQYVPVTSDTSQSNHQSITNLSLKEFMDLDYSEVQKRFPETVTQPRIKALCRFVKCWDEIGSEGGPCLEVLICLHSQVPKESRKHSFTCPDPYTYRDPFTTGKSIFL